MVSFKARRSEPELVAPASPTPRECKLLSDIDSQHVLRFYATGVEFFRPRRAADQPEVDAAKAVKVALAKALVYYYPMAGRLRETPDGKLAVECTGEGVVFVEADADVRLDELGEPLVPPYPCVEELVCFTGSVKDVVARPLLFAQVTRLKCGGFAVGTSVCHNMADAFGVMQFFKAVTDLARGDDHPAVLPAWGRDLLVSRDPPSFADLPFLSGEAASPDGDITTTPPPMPMDRMVGDYFLFGPREITAMRSQVAEPATEFELITAAVWKCRTQALALACGGAQPPASLLITVNVRGSAKLAQPLPQGYYGNGFVVAPASCGGDLGALGLDDVVGLVRRGKRGVTDGYVRSMVDLVSTGGTAPYTPGWTFVVSDITRIGQDALDMGWAERVGGGVPIVGDDEASKMVSYHMRCRNSDGEESVVVSMYLPEQAMEAFRELINTI